eukprot:COSAG01_NODE_1406_length_10435_cov_24.133017_14_plen_377_part_01
MSATFIAACDAGDAAAVRRHLADGADANTVKPNGWPVLGSAAYYGHAEVIRALAEAGATVDRPNSGGATPLCVASQLGHTAAVEALLGGGATVDRPDKYGATPLYIASMQGHVAAVEALLGGGATVDRPGKYGATPFYIASTKGHADVVRRLLLAGANRACVWQGKTSLDIAQANGHADVVALLRNPWEGEVVAGRAHSASPLAPSPAPASRCICHVKFGAEEQGPLGIEFKEVSIQNVDPQGMGQLRCAYSLQPGMILRTINGVPVDRLAFNAVLELVGHHGGDTRGLTLKFKTEQDHDMLAAPQVEGGGPVRCDDSSDDDEEAGICHVKFGAEDQGQLGIEFKEVSIKSVDPQGMGQLRCAYRLEPGMVLQAVNN